MNCAVKDNCPPRIMLRPRQYREKENVCHSTSFMCVHSLIEKDKEQHRRNLEYKPRKREKFNN